MQRLDEKSARCFQRLQADDFAALVEYLRESRKGTLEDLAAAPQLEQIYRLQGEAAVLSKLLENIEKSNDLVTKLASNRKG